MSTTFKKTIAGVAMLAMLALLAPTVKAETSLEALTNQLAALQAQIAALTGGSTSCTAFGVSAVVRQGMTGANVVAVQKAVNHTGAATLSTDGSFGPMTKDGVMKAQVKVGAGADGVWGPNTQAKYMAWVNSSCADDDSNDDSNDDDSNDDGPLTGGAGSITVTSSSEFSGEDVGEGAEDVGVLAFEVEADEESDVEITSVKVEFEQTVSTNSEDLSDYADSVSIWLDGEMVGEADADDFNEVTSNDSWTKSITLNDAVIDAGDEMEFTVAVTASNNLDSGDINDDAWTADVLNVRFEDADGVVTTEDTDSDTLEKDFDFDSFATATGLELKVSLNDEEDAVNEAHVIDVDDTTDTNDVAILAFTMEADGESDIHVTEVPVLVTVTGSTDVDDMITGITLWMGDDQIGSESVTSTSSTNVYTFDDLDIDIAEGETEEFWVKVDLKSTGDVDLDAGDTIMADLDSTRVDLIEAEDESGEDLTSSELTGSADGEASTVLATGIFAEFVDTSYTVTAVDGGADVINFEIVFDVTAFDTDAFVDGSAITDEAGGATYQNILGDGFVATAVLDSDADDASNTTFQVDEGTTKRFTLTVSGVGTGAFAQASLESILYATTAIDGDTLYTYNMGDFESQSVFVSGS